MAVPSLTSPIADPLTPLMRPVPQVVSINISAGGIPKRPVQTIDVLEGGLRDDAHDHEKHNTPLQAVSLIDVEDLDALRTEGFPVYPGATGENITVRNLQVDALPVGTRLKFSGGVELELSKVRQPCFVLDSIDPQLKKSIIGRCGFLAKVIAPGRLTQGELIEVRPG